MSEIKGEVKAQLILATADVIINKGLPALVKFVSELKNKEVIIKMAGFLAGRILKDLNK